MSLRGVNLNSRRAQSLQPSCLKGPPCMPLVSGLLPEHLPQATRQLAATTQGPLPSHGPNGKNDLLPGHLPSPQPPLQSPPMDIPQTRTGTMERGLLSETQRLIFCLCRLGQPWGRGETHYWGQREQGGRPSLSLSLLRPQLSHL